MSAKPKRSERARGRARAGLGAALVLGAFVAAAVALAPRARVPPAGTPTSTSIPSSTSATRVTPSAEPVDAGAPAAPSAAPPPPYVELDGGTLKQRNAVLLTNMQHALGLSEAQMTRVRKVFDDSEYIGQGNPKPTTHPVTRAECLERRKNAPHLASAEPRCGAPNMVPLYDVKNGEQASQAKVCIDQYEFPNMVCEYPVVWVRSNEAQELCHAQGKRLCDAHEWEGGCAGSLESAESEYAFGERRIMMQYLHNKTRDITWAYGKEKNHALCATSSKKNKDCPLPSFEHCGSNDFPAGAFPECVSSLGVYDQHGNAAEHMSFPRKPEELGSRGGVGETEMKGSWFIFSTYEAHEDDCRWRAPDWHVTRIDDPNSHRNYHLGFRCCRDVEALR